MEGSAVAVSVQNAFKSYGTKPVLNNLCMKVERGTIYGLLGPSGCGKTTLLSAIVGRKRLNSGNIYVLGGEPGTAGSGVPGPKVGYMPQDIALVGEFSVRDAVFYFGRVFRMSENAIEERFRKLSALLELPPDDRYIKNCSGGQQRRVSFAAALVHSPELLILDEPTVGLDPVLRDSIWHYLVEITEKERVAVIITTHYIEETRQAHKVSVREDHIICRTCTMFINHHREAIAIGMMRHGTLLAEEAPDVLLRLFGTTTLEECFFILSQQQAHGSHPTIPNNNQVAIDAPDTVAPHLSASTDKIVAVKRAKTKRSQANLNGMRLKALLAKNWIQFSRNPAGLAFMLLFPLIEILAFFFAVGNDVKNIPIGIVNAETNFSACRDFNRSATVTVGSNFECSFRNLGCRFLDAINDPMIEQITYNDVHRAKEDIRHGKVTGTLYITRNFTDSLEKKVIASKRSEELLNNSQVMIWLDMSNRQIGAFIKFKLIEKVIDFQTDLIKDCHYEAKAGKVPINFEEYMYGDKTDTYSNFMVPGVLISLIFFLGTTNASTIIISDQLEGVWDRSIVAGVTSAEILLTHFVTQFLIIVAQTCELFFITFVLFDTDVAGSMGTITLLVLLQGVAGMSYGFLISVYSESYFVANVMGTGSFYPMLMTSGVVWPIEGMPDILRYLSLCTPFTLPIVSLRNVIKKGWTITDLQVYPGIGMELFWTLVLGLISLYLLKKKR